MIKGVVHLMKNKSRENGQALIIIAFAATGLFAFAALAIDGSMAFSNKRQSQNAADTAALAAALSYIRDNSITLSDLTTAAQNRATSNGFDNGEMSDVSVTVVDIALGSGGCPGDTAGKEITVTIVSRVNTTFARVIGRNQLSSAVTATSRGCGYYKASLFNGNAVVGLNPSTTNCSFDTGNSGSVTWQVEGSGIFSNGCAFSKNQDDVFEFIGSNCVNAVGAVSGFPDEDCINDNAASEAINYPDDVIAIMPPNPCDGTPGDVGLPPPVSGSTFTNGVFCISDLDAYNQEDIILNNATLYVTDPVFDLRFAGGGGLYGTATQGGDFDDYYMVVPYDSSLTPCPTFTSNSTQVIEWRGNGAGTFTGTILAPMACLDLRGNADQTAINSQVIGYIVGSNGNANVYVSYDPDQNHQNPVYPAITLLK